jgi:excisionase family DNA binding protein
VDMEQTSTSLLLSRREAAQALGVSIDTLAQLISTGELRVVRFGRSVRVPRAEVLTLVERRLTETTVAVQPAGSTPRPGVEGGDSAAPGRGA